MLNILVVNENFTGGGLETHIHSYYMELRKKHHFVFAFGNFKSELEFAEADVHTGFHFGWRSTVEEFVADVERLLQLIRREKIDVIHAHPFHSIFPAVVAGQLAGIPVACTHHGTYSFAFPGGVNEALLLYYAYTELVGCVFSVSQTGKQALETRAHVPNVVFMPNAIDTRLYRHHKVVNNRRWAVISRLDGDMGKAAALKKLFEAMPSLPINSVDVYGDGAQRQMLEETVKKLGLTAKVRFMGFQSDLYERLDGNYNGIIGSDRVALEGLTMGYPVLELGYDRICGILYGTALQKAKSCNFVANTLPALDSDTVASQLEQVYATPAQFDFRQEMVNAFDIQSIAKVYVKRLSALDPAPHANIVTWFEDVKALPDPKVNFYASQNVFHTIEKDIGPYTIDRNMKDLFILTGCFEGLKGESGQLQMSLAEQTQLLGQAQTQILDMEEEQGRLQAQFSGLEGAWGELQARVSGLEGTQGELQTWASDIEEEQRRLQEQLFGLQKTQRELQTQLFDVKNTQGELQAQLQVQAQLLVQIQEQTEYHRKILAPLIWLRRFLSKIKWKIIDRLK